jgi:TRAP transporter 4TM/12TM fusion protein
MANQYLTHEGLFSSVLGVAATLVPAFILFGCALQIAGVADLLMTLASQLSLGPGGPAKLAVTGSALFGTISGSSTANVVGTGTTTIPLMKRAGFEPSFAGAVEAVASTGGQIMPPVMGVAAFLMSEVTGIPYVTIAIAAVVPALLYYAAVYIEVDLEARRLSLTGALTDALASSRSVWQRAYMLLPFVVLIYLLFMMYSPMKSALWATVGVVLLTFVSRETWLTREKLQSLVRMFTQGTLTVALACATAGIVVGALNITGAGLRMTFVLVEMAGKERILLAIIVMIICIILGMGLPTPAAYAVAASFAAPMLAMVAMNKMQAHMFILYYASLSSITPPVAIAAYAAAGIADAPPMRTGWIAWKLGLAAFIVPFMFTENTALFIGQAAVFDTVQATLTGLLGVACLAMATIGYLFGPITLYERGGYFLASLLLLYPTVLVSLFGIAIAGVLLAVHISKYRLKPKWKTPSE